MSDLFNTGIRPVVDQYLLDEAAKVRSYGDYWSASSAGYCMRKLIFERLGVPTTQEADPRKQRVFSAGHIFHEWLQKLTRDAGISIAQEVELQDEDLMVRGHFDDLVLVDASIHTYRDPLAVVEAADWPPKKLILYDYKTVNSRSFMWAKKNGNAMSHYHRMQLGTYMYMLRNYKGLITRSDVTITNKDLTEARILKIEKENLMMMEQQLMWSASLAREVITYWNKINELWRLKKIPPCACADHEGGFMAQEKFNPFFYDGEPCSIKYYNKCKKEGLLS